MTTKTAPRAALSQLQGLAAQGVERAIAARMTELSAEQVQAVSGGASYSTLLLKGPLINGIINPLILKQLQGSAMGQPGINPGAINTLGVLIGR